MDGWDRSRRAVSRTRARPRDRRSRGPTSIVVDSRLAARVGIQQQAENIIIIIIIIKTTSKQSKAKQSERANERANARVDDDDEMHDFFSMKSRWISS